MMGLTRGFSKQVMWFSPIYRNHLWGLCFIFTYTVCVIPVTCHNKQHLAFLVDFNLPSIFWSDCVNWKNKTETMWFFLSMKMPDVLSLCQLYNVPRLLCMSKIINDSEVIHLLALSSYRPTKFIRQCIVNVPICIGYLYRLHMMRGGCETGLLLTVVTFCGKLNSSASLCLCFQDMTSSQDAKREQRFESWRFTDVVCSNRSLIKW